MHMLNYSFDILSENLKNESLSKINLLLFKYIYIILELISMTCFGYKIEGMETGLNM